MLKLDGKTLQYDRAFTNNGISYPANWLRLTTLEEKQAIGISEVADDTQSWDQRFYWGVDNPKQLDDKTETIDGVEVTTTGLKTLWKAAQTDYASSVLSQSDWRVVKAKETGTNIPSTWKTYRAAVRTSCNTRQTEIDACKDVPALVELLFGQATIDRQKTDSEGKGIVDEKGAAVIETVPNPAIATAWPTPI